MRKTAPFLEFIIRDIQKMVETLLFHYDTLQLDAFYNIVYATLGYILYQTTLRS